MKIVNTEKRRKKEEGDTITCDPGSIRKGGQVVKLDLIYVIYGFLGLFLVTGWIQEEVRAWLKNRKR